MSRISINILHTKQYGLTIYVNIYDSSAKSLASLFDKQYEKQVLDSLNNDTDSINKIIENVNFRLENSETSFGIWIWVRCKLKDADKLLQVFADETIKAEIIRKVFEYV